MQSSRRIIMFATAILPLFHLLGLGMNVAWIAPLLTVLFLSELLVTSTDAIFFPSLLPSSKVKTHFPTSVKLDDKDAEFKNRQHPQSKQKPHIIIILADDMGWNDVSFHGSDQIPTPNIDALAYNGIILNNHYVPALCTPSRTALMTGKNPIHLGMQHSVILPAEPRGLPFTEKLLPEYLKELGYKTHAVGKWHLGFYKKRYTPTFRGFDSHFGYWNGLQDYFTHITQDPDPQFSNFKGFDMRRNLTVAWETEGKYSTDLFTDEAVRLINEHNKDQPMFLYLAHLAPHKGNQKQLFRAPDEDIAKFSYIIDPERRIQAAVISKLDEGVGAVMDALRHRGMLENSIVLFMSDNGAPTIGILSNQGSNYPLRGIKDSPWEGGTRGVAAIWSPLIKKSKRVSNQMMFMADWLPTLLSAAENVDWASVVLALRDEEGVVPSPPFITFTNVTFAVVKCCPPPVDIGESRGTKKLEEVSYSKLNHSTDPSIRRAKTKYRTSLKRLNTLIATLQLLKLSVGVERERLGNIDGFDLWRTLTADKISPRSDIVINIDDISNYAAIRRGDFKYIIGETDTGSAWVGATGNSSEGISPKYDPYKVLYSKAGAAISGVITARQAMELNEKRKNEENVNGDPLIKDFHEKILTANEILELRNKAQIQCNVKEENKIPCDPRKAPCLFNIEKDPCEMVNLANSRPVILAILEKILTKYRLTTVPPSNVNEDPKANPALWNNTWVSWDDPHPFALAQTNNELQPRSAPAIAVVSIICGLFVVGVMTLLALKCRKSNSNSLEDFDEDSIAMARIAENEKRDDTLKDEDLTSKPL